MGLLLSSVFLWIVVEVLIKVERGTLKIETVIYCGKKRKPKRRRAPEIQSFEKRVEH